MKKTIWFVALSASLIMLAQFMVRQTNWYYLNFIQVKYVIPGNMFGSFKSFDSIEHVRSVLRTENRLWKEEGPSNLARYSNFPPCIEFSIVVSVFEEQGISGELQFYFNNDRLYKMIFIPNDVEKYLKLMSSKIGNRIIGDQEFEWHNDVNFSFKEHASKPYFLWKDRSIFRELNEWDKIYDRS